MSKLIKLFSQSTVSIFSLKNHFKLLENLKKKDPPILTNDEIIAATEEVERLTNFLKEDIAIAKVNKTTFY